MYKVLAFIQKLVLINVTEQNYVFTCKNILREITDKTGKKRNGVHIYWDNQLRSKRASREYVINTICNKCLLFRKRNKIILKMEKSLHLFIYGWIQYDVWLFSWSYFCVKCMLFTPPQKKNPIINKNKKKTH